jgi:hypothetical protein
VQSLGPLSERDALLHNMGNSMAFSLILDPRFVGEEESHLTGNVPRSIFQLCSIYGKARCEDQRDKIFGLLGITSSCCSRAIQVDYSAPLSELAQVVLLHHICDHQDGSLMTLESFIDFHHFLGIIPIDYKPPPRSLRQILPAKDGLKADQRIIASAELLNYGPLEYISTPLDGSVPTLPPELEWELQRLMSADDSTWIDKKSLRSRIAMHPDLILPLDHSTDCEVVLAHDVSKRQPRRQDDPTPDDPPILFRKLMLECQAVLAKVPQAKDKRLALCQSGLTFLVPENVRTGDQAYRIRGRNNLIIVRPSEQYPRICYPVARSVFTLWFGFNSWVVDHGGDASLRSTKFKLDLYTLQMMSVTSSFPPEQAVDEDQNLRGATGLR